MRKVCIIAAVALFGLPMAAVTLADASRGGAGTEHGGSTVRIRVVEPPLRPFPCFVATHQGGRTGIFGYLDPDTQVLYAWKDVTMDMRLVPGVRDNFHALTIVDLGRINRVVNEDPPIYFRRIEGGRLAPGYFAKHVRETFFQWKKVYLSADDLDTEAIKQFILKNEDIQYVVEIEPTAAMIRRVRPR